MPSVTIYSTGTCPICQKTKGLLKKWAIEYDEIRIDLDRSKMKEFSEVTQGARMVPQLTINGKWIGGFTELTEMHMDGELDELMNS